MFKTSGHHKNRGFEKLAFRKKNAVKNEIKIFQNIIFADFSKQILFFMSNVNVECFQLSFDICTYCQCRTKNDEFSKIVQKISAVKVVNFGAASRQNYAT